MLADVPSEARVSCEEVFGPVVVIDVVDSLDEAFARVNDSRFGLQAGVFTDDLRWRSTPPRSSTSAAW